MYAEDITIPKGTEITAYVNGDIPLDPKRFAVRTVVNPEAGVTPVQPTTDAAPTQTGDGLGAAISTVNIKSTPDGAEITLDEKFVRSTPSSPRLAAGESQDQVGKAWLQDLGENFDCGCRRDHDIRRLARKTVGVDNSGRRASKPRGHSLLASLSENGWR